MEQIDYLSQLPIELFMTQITYLPATEVDKICTINKKLHNYCTSSQYMLYWKNLIDAAYSRIPNYKSKLVEVRKVLGLEPDTYNYQIYTRFVTLIDPITQLHIYLRQKDMDSFNRVLSNLIQQYKQEYDYSNDSYYEYIVIYKAIDKGYLNIVKYFADHGKNMNTNLFPVLARATWNGNLEIVKYLVEEVGVNDPFLFDVLATSAKKEGYVSVSDYLIKRGATLMDGHISMRYRMIHKIPRSVIRGMGV